MSGVDPRVSPVEDNIIFFVNRVLDNGPDWLIDRSRPSVSAYSSDVAFPLFNVVTGARVDPSEICDLAGSVGKEFIDRGMPWMWWTTPSYTSPELEGALTDLGLTSEDVPGMYADLESIPEIHPNLDLAEVPVEDPDFGRVLIDGFGLPEFVINPISDVFGSFSDAEQIAVLARVDGTAAGVATGLISGETVGIYNVGTRPSYRGRGVGSATTAAIMRAGKQRGCSNAILHSSPMGRSVYERLGFEVVCPTTQWVWAPAET